MAGGRIRTAVWLAVLFLACVRTEAPQAQLLGAASLAPAMHYRLEAKQRYTVGEPVEVRFVLVNATDRGVRVLTWYTPLEGIKGKIFEVRRGGVEVAYQGPLVKRGEPGAEDYASLGPGEEVSAEVDLPRSYEFLEGSYTVAFKGRLHDVAWDPTPVPRARDLHRGVTINGNAVAFQIQPR